MKAQFLRRLAGITATFAVLQAGMAVAASPFSSVYVFGDSLSDIGRVSALTGGFPGPTFGYAAGRFSNGPVAVEMLALQLTGQPLALANNYAHGGARTGTSPWSNLDNNNAVLNGTGLQVQTGMFRNTVGAGNADPNALYVVWAGANDFTETQVLTNQGNDWTRVIGNVQTAIGSLAADGARHFFVPNLPNLGLTPNVLAAGALMGDPTFSATVSGLTKNYNTLLRGTLSAFDQASSQLDISFFDVWGFMTDFVNEVAQNGSSNGISNVTGRCLPDNSVTPCMNPDEYLFFDGQHPTARAHELLGMQFAQAVPEPTTLALFVIGLGLVLVAGRRRLSARPSRMAQ